MARRTFPTSIRAAIWRAHDRRCIYCTEPVAFADLDIDHIVPVHFKEKPNQFVELLNEYGLGIDFDLNGLLNLVPTHRHCNLQKKGQVLPKNRALHFLSIAEGKYDQVCKYISQLKEQALKDKVSVLLQVALEEERISREELFSIADRYAKSQNIFEVLMAFPFVDSELKGFLSSTDIDSLYDRPILPRTHGLEKLVMVGPGTTGEEKIEVRTCREWVEATREGYYPSTTYDIKEESFFNKVYALVVALAQAKIPKHKYISDQKASISDIDLLPVTFLPVLSGDDVEELQSFESRGISIADLIVQGKVKVVSSSPLSLTLHYNYMGLCLNEILRADLNDDGIEDILVGGYEWALEGTFGAGFTMAVTRLSRTSLFTVTQGIELDVVRQSTSDHNGNARGATITE